MASTISGNIDFEATFREVLDEGVQRGPLPAVFRAKFNLKNGTAEDQINLMYATRASGVAASTTTVYDLAGTLTDRSGATITFAEVCFIAIRNRSTAAVNRIHIGPDVSNGFGVEASNVGFWADASDRNVVCADASTGGDAGSWQVLYSRTGVPVAAGSTDELAVITQSGSSNNSWDIIIAGRSS